MNAKGANVFMEESSEFIGSMPSVPQPEPSTGNAQQRPAQNNLGLAIGMFLCALCLLVFPTYAHTDDLGTGIFYGVGGIMLSILLSAVCGSVMKRFGKGRPPASPSPGPRPAPKKNPWLQRLNELLFGVVLFLLGLFLLTSPGVPDLGYVSLLGLPVMVIGIGLLFFGIVRSIFGDGRAEAAEAAASPQERKQEEVITNGLVWLLIGGCFLAFPQFTSLSELFRGILYGIGLVMLLLALLVLSSGITRNIARRKSASQP